MIPLPYPERLEDCLLVFEKLKYKSFGFPMVFLSFDFFNKNWDFGFRNPANFENPNINGKTPIDAIHKMFDFLLSEKITNKFDGN